MNVRELIAALERDGWTLVRIKGSHRQFRHREKPGLVTIAGHPGDTPPPKTLASIFIQAGWKRQ